ncbi:glycosyltransferase family 39 protein [Candidatus Bathyarchaeota archaeon]|nr:glycosyltransferase family 39 protein [Candidatus Bathyarchaeota archaeon]
MSVQWDEIPHLYGGLLLTRGQSQEYVTTYGYYPPLYDILTTVFFHVLGASAASGRLVAVMFSLLSLWIVFEFANRTYGPKIALLASIMLGVMPGFFWVSRIAMLETALVFFFSLALSFFFSWMRLSQNKTLLLCGLTLGVGFLAKYQILVAGLVMIVAILVLCRKKLRLRFSKFLVLPLIAILVVVPWILVLYQVNGVGKFGELLYVVQEGGQDRAAYSRRFPMPIFYLVEMTWPFNDIPVHPVSLPLYILGLCGLALWAYRRRTEDKFFLVWFITVYVFFTLIPNKQWRYVTPLFPVLAISAADFIFFVYGKIGAVWNAAQASLGNRRVRQIAAALFIVLAASTIFYSSYEAYQMTARDQIHIPIEEAAHYATGNMTQSESMVVLCAFNLFSQDMLRFYLPANMSKDQVWQYPELPVDSFTPSFNITEFIDLCEERNVKWVIFYEYGPDVSFFNTTLSMRNVTTMLGDSGKFGKIADEPWNGFGTYPYRLFIFGFLHN